ncbi:MAG: MmgE/PrpD family protein [Bacillota bacterium]|nr:MmgE/PrpD family protein [Bacillota bacterium]
MKVTGSGEKITLQLAEYLVDLKFADLSEEVITAAKLALLDWFGSALRGRQEEPARIINALVTELGGSPQATNLANIANKTTAINGALVNGTISHIIELDDVHKASIFHAAAPVMPAVLAVAELVGATGIEAITAIVAGYEVGIRLGEAITPSHYEIWHTTGTVGHFAAAASAGVLLKLSTEEMVHAIGTAGTQASGLWEFIEDGAMSKHLHPGKAAMGGVLAGLLAKKGFTAAKKIIEGKRGFVQATSQEVDWTKITEGLGKHYKIMENSYKIHSSCRHTHPALDVAVALKREHGFTPESIKNIKAGVYQVALDITENYHPQTIYQSKFSLPYCVALGIVKGKAGLGEFSESNLWDKEIRNIMSKVELRVDQEIQGLYPKEWGTKLEVELTDGRVITGVTHSPKGDPENPASQEELVSKFKDLTKEMFAVTQIDSFVEHLLRLEELTGMEEVLKWLK